MAITKVKADLIDLNEPNSTKGLKMPSGGAFSGTATEGMVRNDTSQSSISSASTMQFYNGTEWKNFSNLYVPPVGTENFSPYLYTGAGAQGYTGVGFAPDLVWIKRYDSTGSNYVFDTVRGVYKYLISETAAAQVNNSTYLTAFDSDGFTLGTNTAVSGSGNDYIAWCWKAGGATVPNNEGDIQSDVSANVAAGFSIVEYTGVAGGVGLGGQTPVGHGLSAAPELVIYKQYTGSADDWYAMFQDGSQYKAMYLNYNFAGFNQTNDFTSTTIQTYRETSANLVAYCFHSVDGYQKIGIYTGTGSSGNPQNVGFAPRLVMIKGIDAQENWIVHSNVTFTGGATGGANHLRWNTNGALDNGANEAISFTNTGFSIVTSGATQINTSGRDYLYLAIA